MATLLTFFGVIGPQVIIFTHPKNKQNKSYNGRHDSENNENLLAVAWWVILNSPDLLNNFLMISFT